MIDENKINEFLKNDCNLTFLRGKIPTRKNWNKERIQHEYIKKHSGNLGWVLSNSDLVLDIDIRNGGLESFEKLKNKYNLNLFKTVKTANNGFHIYCYMDKNRTISVNHPDYPGIDFLTCGKQVVIPGSILEDSKFYDWHNENFFGFFKQNLPDNFKDDFFIKKSEKSQQIEQNIPDDDVNIFISEDQINEALLNLDPSMDHDNWIKIGMALHSWNAEKGENIWEEWSKNGQNYQENETKKRWKSFSKNDFGITINTLFYMSNENKKLENECKFSELLENLNHYTIDDIKGKLPKISNHLELDNLQISELEKSIQNRIKEIKNIKPSIKIVRDILKSSSLEKYKENNIWKKWVYVIQDNRYYNLDTLQPIRKEGFDQINGVHVPFITENSKPNASKFVSDYNLIRIINKTAYVPYQENVFEMNGEIYLNTYNKKNVPKIADDITDEGKKYIEKFEKHCELITNSQENAKILIQYLAHNVQNPGKKINWCPLIQGIEGIGKSFFTSFFKQIMGVNNVGVVKSDMLGSEFNGWASEKCVNILEEIRIIGKNRYEPMNALKPLITDKSIMINKKGIDAYDSINCTNYMAFTNNKEAIPITSTDRRFWVIFNKIKNTDDIEIITGVKYEEYFEFLFDGLELYGEELKKYFSEYEISEEFKKMKAAPITDDKELMINSEQTAIEGLIEVEDLIKTGNTYYNSDCISSSDLFEQLQISYSDLNLNNYQKNKILKNLGYYQLPRIIKINNNSKRIWVKKEMSNDEIRKCLKDKDEKHNYNLNDS